MGSLATDYEGGWLVIAVRFGQNVGGILFTGITIAYLISQGGVMLAEKFKEEQFRKGQRVLLERLVKDKKLTPEEKERYEDELRYRKP